jgi:hypothetical protein
MILRYDTTTPMTTPMLLAATQRLAYLHSSMYSDIAICGVKYRYRILGGSHEGSPTCILFYPKVNCRGCTKVRCAGRMPGAHCTTLQYHVIVFLVRKREIDVCYRVPVSRWSVCAPRGRDGFFGRKYGEPDEANDELSDVNRPDLVYHLELLDSLHVIVVHVARGVLVSPVHSLHFPTY